MKSKLLIVLDVDGVTRLSVVGKAEPTIVSAVRRILKHDEAKRRISIVFLSGTHAATAKELLDEEAEAAAAERNNNVNSKQLALRGYRMPNLPLADVFERCFTRSELTSRISIRGCLGCEACFILPSEQAAAAAAAASDDNKTGDDDAAALVCLGGNALPGHSFNNVTRIALLSVCLHAYARWLSEFSYLSAEQGETLAALIDAAVARSFEQEKQGTLPSTHTPNTFEDVVLFLRTGVDPFFRLISHASSAELGCAPVKKQQEQKQQQQPGAPTGADYRIDGLKLISYMHDLLQAVPSHHIPDDLKKSLREHVSGGVAHKGHLEFMWCTITKSTKGICCTELLQLPEYKDNTALLTVGDSSVDFSMHWLPETDAAFHVGPISTLRKMAELPHAKASHTTFVPMAATEAAIKQAIAEDAHNSSVSHHGTGDDVQALTLGTLEVLLRLEQELLRCDQEEEASRDDDGIDFGNLVCRVAASFK